VAKISKSFLSEIENGKVSVSSDTLLKIADALNVSLDYLMKGESADTPGPVQVPAELSEFAEERRLTFPVTLSLLNAGNSLLARRSDRGKGKMTKEDWENLYKSLKPYLE
jgi:transcriptional regulator with XRE-family HTH domain